MKKEEWNHCEDCTAYYKGDNHECPPWLKALVKFRKDVEQGKIKKQEIKF